MTKSQEYKDFLNLLSRAETTYETQRENSGELDPHTLKLWNKMMNLRYEQKERRDAEVAAGRMPACPTKTDKLSRPGRSIPSFE